MGWAARFQAEPELVPTKSGALNTKYSETVCTATHQARPKTTQATEAAVHAFLLPERKCRSPRPRRGVWGSGFDHSSLVWGKGSYLGSQGRSTWSHCKVGESLTVHVLTEVMDKSHNLESV